MPGRGGWGVKDDGLLVAPLLPTGEPALLLAPLLPLIGELDSAKFRFKSSGFNTEGLRSTLDRRLW